ncbi:MAG TPA: DUF2059 domain-containing protein [Brevundimonas sp.]|nr:DUF2059 domain-containing protein [Brevundimonas sp.]
MRVLMGLAAVALLSGPAPATAQTTSDPARERQLALADRYLTLTQGGEVLKQLRRQVEEGLGEQDMPADQRAWMSENLSTMMQEVVVATIAEIRDDVAEDFTIEELQGAVDFFESPLGRSVVRKQVDLNAEMQEAMAPMIVPRLTTMMEKFCLRFDCEALGSAAAKSGQ